MPEESQQDWAPTISRASPAAGQATSAASDLTAPEPAHQIGRFMILRPLGEGGMGKVYVGYDEQLNRKVAIKLLRSGREGSHGELRLLREAQALACLSHPNVVQVHEAGTERGAVFVAMELVDGRSLSEWARAKHEWRARLEVLVQAGRGLAAAHAAGLVHRDFKPDNVLVGSDGRVRVLDFGLVRSAAGSSDVDEADLEDTEGDRDFELTAPGVDAGQSTTDDIQRRPMLEAELTVRGTIMGTPAYMAPEQHLGKLCDAAADQFGFCVCAFELLFEQRPFAVKQLSALARAKHAGEIEPIPSDSQVPRAVREAILRGLAATPEQRWPDMEALLAELERGLERRPRRWLPVLAGAAAIALLGVGFGVAGTRDESGQCELDASALAGVWDAPRRRSLRQAFGDTSLRFEADALARTERRLDEWSEAWLAERQASCRATRIEASQSELMLDRREVCLERRRAEFDAVVGVLASADKPVVARVEAVLETLPELGACSVAALDADAEPPLDPDARAEVEAGFGSLAEARAMLQIGRPQVARERAEAVGVRARSLEYTPLALDADAVLAEITIDGGALEAGLEQLRATALAAERARLFDLEASLRVQLATDAAGHFAQPLLERWMIDEAQLALDRVTRPQDPREVTLEVARARVAEQAGDYDQAIIAHERAYAMSDGRLDEARRAVVRVGVGTVRYRAGDYEGARVELEACLATVRQSWGPWAPSGARIEFNLAMIASDLGDAVTAQRHLKSATEIDRELWGDDSLEVARDRFALAYLAFSTGELVDACVLIDDVLRSYERELGSHHDETAQALTAAGVCRFIDDDFDGALASYTRALKIQRELLGDAHYEVGQLYSNIGEVHFTRGDIELARAEYQRAQDIFASALPPSHPLHAEPLRGLALVWLETGEPDRALTALERALELADASLAVELAEVRFGLARALVAVHGHDARARAIDLAELALRGFEDAGTERQAGAARAWLAAERE